MSNRSKHMPYYITIIGLLMLSFGFNLVQNEEIKLLRQENAIYRVCFEYIYYKLELIKKNDRYTSSNL